MNINRNYFKPNQTLTKYKDFRHLLASSHVVNKLGVQHDVWSLDNATSRIDEDGAEPMYSISVMHR